MFTFRTLHKEWRKGKSPPPPKVYSFEEDTKLYVVATLEECLKRTKVWWGKDKKQLLLSFLKPHILCTVRQYLDGLRTSSERQVLILKFLRDVLHFQPQHFRKRFLDYSFNLATVL